MTKTDLMTLLLISLAFVLGLFAYLATKNTENKFSLADAFIDVTGKTSMARMCVFGAFIISSWALVSMVVADELTEWFLTAYLGAFVLNGVGSKFISMKGKS